MVNDLSRVWEENQSITLLWCYFYINKGFYRILVVDEVKNDDIHGKVTKDLWMDILQYFLWREQ